MSSSALRIRISFSRSEIFERTFGLAHWMTRPRVFVSLASSALWRKTNKRRRRKALKNNHRIVPVARNFVARPLLAPLRSSVVAILFWMWDDARRLRFPPWRRLKRCQIKYKMRAFASLKTREGEEETRTFNRRVCFVCTYTSDVNVLCVLRAICVYALWGAHTVGTNSNRRTEVKISKISTFFEATFQETKRRFFLI